MLVRSLSALEADELFNLMKGKALEMAIETMNRTIDKREILPVAKQLKPVAKLLTRKETWAEARANERSKAACENDDKLAKIISSAEHSDVAAVDLRAENGGRSSPFHPFSRFELLHTEKMKNDELLGNPYQSAVETLVDLRLPVMGAQPKLKEIAHQLVQASNVANKIAAKAMNSEALVTSHQGASFIEYVFLTCIPIPKPATSFNADADPWRSEGSLTVETARPPLNAIYQLVSLYFRFTMNLNDDVPYDERKTGYHQCRRVLTVAAAVACYDALMRNKVFSGGHLAIPKVLTGEKACDNSNNGFAPSTTSFKGVSLSYLLSEAMIMRTVEDLRARSAVLQYFQSVQEGTKSGKPKQLLQWNFEKGCFEQPAEDDTFQFVEQIRKEVYGELDETHPKMPEHLKQHAQHAKSLKFNNSRNEKAQWWFWEDWQREPEVRQYLDLVAMLKVAQEPNAFNVKTVGFGNRDFQPVWLPPTSNKEKLGSTKVQLSVCYRAAIRGRLSGGIGEEWTWPGDKDDGDTATCLKRVLQPMLLSDVEFEEFRKALSEEKKRFIEDISTLGEGKFVAGEASALSKCPIETFGNTFSPEEAERFFVFLCAPSVWKFLEVRGVIFYRMAQLSGL
jgi:hypothetical protein